jgi:signal transduction histidine kinase
VSSIGGLLRRRLLLGLIFTLGISGVAASFVVRRALTAQFDAALLAKARLFATVVKADGEGDVTLDLDETPMPEFASGEHADYFQVWRSDGSVVARSPSLGSGNLVAPGREAYEFQDLLLPGRKSGRAVTMRVMARFDDDEDPPPAARTPGPTVGLAVARDRRALDQALAGTSLALGVGALLVLLGIPLLVSGAIRTGLRPLDTLGGRAALIDARSLGQRFSTDGVPDELLPICKRLNDLLERLEVSFERERQFSADVAHELRTPIAELRTVAEVALRFPDGDEDGAAEVDPAPVTTLPARTARSLQEMLGTAVNMEALVSSLLTLSRCESGRQPVHIEAVDLGRICDEAWPPHQRAARKKGVRTVACGAGPAMVMADPVLLGSVVQNLFSNALEYTTPGGEITWSISEEGPRTSLVVDNTNSSLTSSDVPHVFERFWRKDPARTGGNHGGLGLSLAQAFVRLMNGTLGLELRSSDLVRVALSLPSAREASAPRKVFVSFTS